MRIKGLLIAVIALAASGCVSHYDPALPLLTASDHRAPLSDATAVLNGLFRDAKRVVIYVHGRGFEPKKSIDHGTLTKMEKDNDATAVMYNWDAHAWFFNRPVDRAQEGAVGLRDLFVQLGKFRANHPEYDETPVTLLAHSMGSIVLKTAVISDDGKSMTDPNGRPIFKNILITSPDVDRKDHKRWVEMLRASGVILITNNQLDGTLKKSENFGGGTPLGRSDLATLPLAKNAKYLDVTGMIGKVHRIFERSRYKQVYVGQIVQAMLQGSTEPLKDRAKADPVLANVFRPISKESEADPVIRGAQPQPSEDE